MGKEVKASLGALQGLQLGSKKEKQNSVIEVKNNSVLEVKKIKRSYYLTEDCITKLQRMKLENFPIGTSLESIVEKAISDYYENNHKL